MKLISVNVGLPREVTWKGKTVSTGIFKEPVSDRVMVRSLNLDGDGQADLTVHGGADKAVYVYPFEHYEYLGDHCHLPWKRMEMRLQITSVNFSRHDCKLFLPDRDVGSLTNTDSCGGELRSLHP